jgi:radical SAM superfamily enzyme YgiQ (UPF0313 family)
MNDKIFFADLTHTVQGISAATFPLGVSFVMSYAKKELGSDFDLRLFKFPERLQEELQRSRPTMLCLSNYSWNRELSYKIASLAKERYPSLVVVFGGPNFPMDQAEKAETLRTRPAIDFYVELEGEKGFLALAHELGNYGFDAARLKAAGGKILNTAYWNGEALVCGREERIGDLEEIPSPYLSGLLDEFFAYPLVPMIETTRGCPFSCTFCADGIAAKNKVARFSSERTREELHYIARRLKNIDELIITDLNFAMYREDLKTAEAIMEVKNQYGWPVIVSASAGKNKPQRTIAVSNIFKGLWTLGASIQSTDPRVLKAIKRSNISSDAYQQLIEHGNSLKDSKTHSEIILGLPGDTKAKHFESLRFGVDNAVNSMRMFQAMLLTGTEMAAPDTRREYGLKTKFRTIPGCVGYYDLLGSRHAVSEIEEIIVGSKDMPFSDYVECRIMNLIVETFYNNALFDEAFSLVRTLKGSVFDCLLYIKEHPERYTSKMKDIVAEFVTQTSCDLYDSFEEAQSRVLTPEVIEKYIGGELGINELLVHKALLFREFEDICGVLFAAVRAVLDSHGRLSPRVDAYLRELETFTLLRKKNTVTETGLVLSGRFHYDFEAIEKANFRIDPEQWPVAAVPIEFSFFHEESQKKHIANQLRTYRDTPIGLGRLIQRSNLKLMYRRFVKKVALVA